MAEMVSDTDEQRAARIRRRIVWRPRVVTPRRAGLSSWELMEFSGRLAAFPVSDILQWAANDRRTGALVVRRARREKRDLFPRRRGRGVHLRRPGGVLRPASAAPGPSRRGPPGQGADLLPEAGQAPRPRAARARAAVAGARSRRPCAPRSRTRCATSSCGATESSSSRPRCRRLEEILPEPIHTVGLVMEGIRWMDEHQRIRSVFIHDNVVLKRGVRWPGERLSPLQKRIAAGVDGRGTLADLYREVKGSHFRFLEAAFDLAVREVLDIESVGEATAQTSHEIKLYDLLVEQAAEEQILAGPRPPDGAGRPAGRLLSDLGQRAAGRGAAGALAGAAEFLPADRRPARAARAVLPRSVGHEPGARSPAAPAPGAQRRRCCRTRSSSSRRTRGAGARRRGGGGGSGCSRRRAPTA